MHALINPVEATGSPAPKWAFAAICGGLIASAPSSFVVAGEIALRCTNPYSRTSWHININYNQRTVDTFPAKITPTEISWHDTVHGGYYYLNRKTGALTVLFASSTGGYALHDICDVR